MDPHWQCVFVANGEIHAQQVLAFLQAAGIASLIRGESLRTTHGLTLNGLGAVGIFVREDQADGARALLASAEAGKFRLADDVENQSSDENGAPRRT